MANVSASTENADQLRRRANRRLLGASVLLLIAIILVPIFLEREPPLLPDNVDVKIPPIDGTKFDPKLPDRKGAQTEVPSITEPIGAAAGALPPPVSTTAPASATTTTQPSAVTPDSTKASGQLKQDPIKKENTTVAKESGAIAPSAAAKNSPASPPPKVAEKPAEKAPEKAPTKPNVKSGQLVVQLVAVRDPASAKQVYDKAKALKMPAYTEQLTVTNGTVTRVRVGPYEDKKSAEAARVKLAKAGLEAKVITLP